MAVKRRVFTEFDPPGDPGVDCSNLPSMTKQSFKDECDINRILERYEATGGFSAFHTGPDGMTPRELPMYGDFASAPDFMQAQEMILRARSQFDALPARLRERFANDPARLLAFVGDDANRDEAVRLGICNPPPEEKKAEPPPVVPPKA